MTKPKCKQRYDVLRENPHSREVIKASIYGSTIARLAQDKLAEGRGAPDENDMRNFAEEAEAVVELWTETVLYNHKV